MKSNNQWVAGKKYVTIGGGGTGGGIAAAFTGNTEGVMATVSTGTLILAGGNNITLSQNGQSVTISGANAGGAQTGISGMSAGTTQATSGTVSFADSNGVTWGMNGNTLTATVKTDYLTSQSNQAVSAANGSYAFQTLSFSNANGMSFGTSAGSAITGSYTVPTVTNSSWTVSDNGTSGTVGRLAFTNINGVTLSLSTGAGGSHTIVGSHNAITSQSVQTQSNVQGIIISNTTYRTGDVSFSNLNGISFGSNGANVVTASYTVPTQSNQTVGVYGSSQTTGSASSGTHDARSLSFIGAGAISIGNHSTSVGGTTTGIIISAPVQSVQTQNRFNLTLSGNSTSGGAGYIQVSSGTLTLAGGNNITLSQDGNAITISGANAGGVQTGISGIVVSDTTYTSGTVSFSNAGNITISSSVNGATQYIRLSGNAAQTNQSAIKGFGVSNTGQTAGNTGISTGIDWVLAGSNSITLSQSTAGGGPNTVWIQHPAWLTTAMLSNAATISNINLSAGTTSSNLSAFVLSNSNNVSFGLNGATVTATVTVPAQTNQTVGIYGSSQTTGSASSGTHDARSMSFIGAGIISIGNHSTSAGGTTTGIIISATQSNQAFSADASSTFQTLSFQNSNGVSFSNNAGALRVTHDLAFSSQTNHTGRIYVTAQSTGQSSSSTYDLRTLSIIPDGIVSAGWSNGSFRISATQSNQAFSAGAASSTFQTLSFQDSNGISFSNNAGAIRLTHGLMHSTEVAASASNGSFSFKTLNFSNANNVTFGTSAGGIVTASVAAPGAAAENNWFNLLGVNTGGNTTASGSTIGLSGINLTLSGTNNSAINISAPATSSLVGASGITVSTNGSTITVGQNLQSYWDNMGGAWFNSTTMNMFQSTSHVFPFVFDDPMSIGFIRIPNTASLLGASSTGVTTGNSQFSYGHTRSHNFVVYSRGVGASSLSLMSVGSTQLTDMQSINISAAANSTQFSYTNRATYQQSSGTTGFTFDYSSSAASLNFHTSNMTGITGLKMIEFNWATSFAPGQYWLMYGVSTSTASQYTAQGTRLFNVFSNYGMSMNTLQFGTLGATTNSSVGPFFGHGSFTTAGGSTTANLPISAISTTASHNKMFFQVGRIA